MTRTSTDYFHISFPTSIKFSLSNDTKLVICLFKPLVRCMGKNFFKKVVCSSNHDLMFWGLNELNHNLALSFNVNGKGFNLISSMNAVPSWKVLQISSNSLMWMYGFSFPIPWNWGRSGTKWVFITLVAYKKNK